MEHRAFRAQSRESIEHRAKSKESGAALYWEAVAEVSGQIAYILHAITSDGESSIASYLNFP